MKSWTLATIWVIATLAAPPVALPAGADQDSNPKLSVTVSFGAGLNTAQPGNSANSHILPPTIKVKQGGVVNFVVAGFHQIFVYNPGKAPEDVVVPAAGLFINDLAGLYYRGLDPSAPPPAGFSNAMNRVESVSFSAPGVYLVICNVRTHFLDGMFARVQVSDSDDDQ